MEKEPLPLGDWNRALSALDRDEPAEESVEESWDWDPEATEPGAESTAPAPPVVRSAAAIWAWVPDKAPVVPASVETPAAAPEPDAEIEAKPQPQPKSGRKSKRKQKRNAEVVPPPEPEPEPQPKLAHVPKKRKRKAKAGPAAKPVLAPVPVPVSVPDPEPEVVGKRRRGRKNVVVPDWDALEVEEPAEDVAAPPSRRRKVVKVGLVAALIAACATLPWVAPQVPDLFAKVVPESTSTPAPSDEPVEPLTSPPPTTVKADPTMIGTRLKSAGKPLELWVPRLHVRSEVVPISGQTGELIPPDDPQVLGWWQEGRQAGAAHGSVVITGHTVNGGGGAFDHLGELVPGDRIRVKTEAGSIRYVVQESRDVSVAKLARTAEEIFEQDGDGRLVLITCSDFNGEIYLSNSVVYATPMKDEPVDDESTNDASPTVSPVERH